MAVHGEEKLPCRGRLGRRIGGATLAITLLILGGASRVFAGTQLAFPRPAAIEPNVKFWVDVFTAYGSRDFVVHDRDHVRKTYQVLHLPGVGEPSRQEVDAINGYLKTKYAAILNRLATGATPADYEEQQIAMLFKGEPLSAYTEAAQNLRVQEGLRERFMMGLLRSRYYRATMERIFKSAGLPPELVTLAEVESGFDSRAKSGAGAVGIWQFTRATGTEYLKITRYRDERLDPTTSTEAAAQLLRHNYDMLGSWPLAITAYNYGTGGTEDAAQVCKGDYSEIFKTYNGPHFGFASKNYYPEFLAALQVHQYEDAYFPNLKYTEEPPPPLVNTNVVPKRMTRRPHLRRHRHTVASSPPAHHRATHTASTRVRNRHHGQIVVEWAPSA
jgi:peptidoglycan lytic transglycosylase D